MSQLHAERVVRLSFIISLFIIANSLKCMLADDKPAQRFVNPQSLSVRATKGLENAENQLGAIDKEKDPDAWNAQDNVVLQATKNLDWLEHEVKTLRSIEELAPLAAELNLPVVVTATTRELPIFVVKLKSADFDEMPLRIQKGGDNRSGRQARWRFEVKDSNDELVQTRPKEGFMGGGVTQDGTLKFGETWATALSMSSFVRLPKTGEYTVTVLYHNQLTIADVKDPDALNDLILFRSKPFKLKIEKAAPRVLQLENGSHAKAESQIHRLPETGVVKVVCGKYDESFHRFVAPDSAAGKLLQMDWQAVPALLDALKAKQLTNHQKSWVLSLLYTITREDDFDPMSFSEAFPVLHWQSHPSCYGSCGGSLSPPEQTKLIKNWIEFQTEYLDIRETESTK